MKTPTTDTDPLPRRCQRLVPLTGLTAGQVRTVYLTAQQVLPRRPGRPWALPLAVPILLVLVHLHTNLTTLALAVLFTTSKSTVDRISGHLVPIPATALRPEPAAHHNMPWIIDGTLIPVHDQSITAPSKNYRRSINTQIVICSPSRAVVAVGDRWPGNRNDVIVARHTVAHLLTGEGVILGDGGYRGIDTITTPVRDTTGRIIHDDHYRNHRRIRARVEPVIARLKDRPVLRQCRRRGQAINHSPHIIAGIWNLKTTGAQPI